MDTDTVTSIGRRVREAELTRTPIEPLSDEYDLDVADAYAIQEAYSRLRRDDGAALVGRKIGCTSAAMQDRFSIDTPDWGQLFDDMVVDDGGAIPTDELIAPMVEPEVGFRLDAPVRGPGVTRQDVLDATDAVFPCLEIIDSRIVDWRIRFEDTVADNGSSARCVFGSTRRLPADLDLADERIRFLRDGEQVAEGTSEAVLGHPAEAVAWLANAIADFDRELDAGQWILSGSITNAVEVAPGERYEARFDNLGSVTCRFS